MLFDFLELPRITSITKNMAVREGSYVTLTCQVRGYPKPTISWYRHNQIIKQSGQLIVYVQLDSQGMYACKASNRYGSDQRVVNIAVKSGKGTPWYK